MLQEPAQFGPELDPHQFTAALGLSADDAHGELPPQVVNTGINHVMLPLASPEAIARIQAEPAAVDALLAEVRGVRRLCGLVRAGARDGPHAHVRP